MILLSSRLSRDVQTKTAISAVTCLPSGKSRQNLRPPRGLAELEEMQLLHKKHALKLIPKWLYRDAQLLGERNALIIVNSLGRPKAINLYSKCEKQSTLKVQHLGNKLSIDANHHQLY